MHKVIMVSYTSTLQDRFIISQVCRMWGASRWVMSTCKSTGQRPVQQVWIWTAN